MNRLPFVNFDKQRVQALMFWMLVVTMVLTAIVAVGNWQLYSRVEKLETIHGLQATPQ